MCKDSVALKNFVADFSKLPAELRDGRDTKGLVPIEIGEQFVTMPKPMPCEFWTLRTASGAGRIAASCSLTENQRGYIGFFEASDGAVAETLIQLALDWLRQQNRTEIHAPVNFNTWFSYRFLHPAHLAEDQNWFSWEPIHPLSYNAYFKSHGFRTSALYHTAAYTDLPTMSAVLKKDFLRSQANGYRFRPFDEKNLLAKEVSILHEISHRSFGDNFLFEPISLPLFQQLYVPMAQKKPVLCSFFACDSEHLEVGFFFGFIDQDHLILKSTAVTPEHRGQGLSNALVHLMLEFAIARGLTKAVSALVKSGLRSESYSKHAQPLWRREYELLSYSEL